MPTPPTRKFRTEDGYTLYLHADGHWRDAPEGDIYFDLTFNADANAHPIDSEGEPLSGQYID